MRGIKVLGLVTLAGIGPLTAGESRAQVPSTTLPPKPKIKVEPFPKLDLITCGIGLDWRATYYKGSKPTTGNAVAIECLPTPFKRDYAAKKPPAAVKAGAFSVVFTLTMNTSVSGTYTLGFRFDGKAIVKLDGTPVALLFKKAEDIYSGASPNVEGTMNVAISAGKHTLAVEYFDVMSPGYAAIELKLGEIDCPKGTWKAAFYGSKDLSGSPITQRCDSKLDFNWLGKSPASGVPATNWSARWRKKIWATKGDAFKYVVKSNDGFRIFFDSMLVYDGWSGPTASPLGDAPVTKATLATSSVKKVKVEYWNGTGPSFIHLSETICPGNKASVSLELPESGQDNTLPFTVKVAASACIGAKARRIYIDGALKKSCDGSGSACTFTAQSGFVGKGTIVVRGEVDPVVGATVKTETSYKLSTCNDKVKSGDEDGADCGGSCVFLCPKAVSVNMNSQNVIEGVDANVQAKFSDGSDVNADNTGKLAHKVKYTWRYYAGHGVVAMRLHFSKLSLKTAKLSVGTVDGTKWFDVSDGTLDAKGWTGLVPGGAFAVTLDTDSVTFDGSNGFAIDKVEVTAVKFPLVTSRPFGVSNREWHGSVGGNGAKVDIFTFVPESDGLHDIFVRSQNGTAMELFVQELGGSAAPTIVTSGFKLAKVDCSASDTKLDSQIVSANLKNGVAYMLRVRGFANDDAYTLAVNRVALVQDIEFDFDSDFEGGNWTLRERQMKELFREATERIASATDGYARLGKIFYWHWDDYSGGNDTDGTFENESGRANCVADVSLYLDHLNSYCGTTSNKVGGMTYAHEWMHDFPDILDEYNDDPADYSVGLCPYSIMSNTNAAVPDLCTDKNHNPNTGALCCWMWQGGESSWETFVEWLDPNETIKKRMNEVKARTPSPHNYDKSAVRNTIEFVSCSNPPSQYKETCDDLD